MMCSGRFDEAVGHEAVQADDAAFGVPQVAQKSDAPAAHCGHPHGRRTVAVTRSPVERPTTLLACCLDLAEDLVANYQAGASGGRGAELRLDDLAVGPADAGLDDLESHVVRPDRAAVDLGQVEEMRVPGVTAKPETEVLMDTYLLPWH